MNAAPSPAPPGRATDCSARPTAGPSSSTRSARCRCSLQAKLLRVLEDGIVRPVGADRASKIDARVIAASNTDLVAGGEGQAFREDLFYRLQVVPIVIRAAARTPLGYSDCWSSISSTGCTRGCPAATGRSRARRWSPVVLRLAGQRSRTGEHGRAPGDHVRGLDHRHRNFCPRHLSNSTRTAETGIPATLAEAGINLNAVVRELEGRMINEALKQTGGNKQAAAQSAGTQAHDLSPPSCAAAALSHRQA